MRTALPDGGRRRTEDIDGIVIDIVRKADRPVSAYAIVAETRRLGSPMVPTQVYRSIGRLICAHQIERIASLKAFVPADACQRLHLICAECGEVCSIRIEAAEKVLGDLCQRSAFMRKCAHLEMAGICPSCAA